MVNWKGPRTWACTFACVPKQHLSQPSCLLKSNRAFIPSYEKDKLSPTPMSWIMGWEYGRIWKKERDEYRKKMEKKMKTKIIKQPPYKSRIAPRLLGLLQENSASWKGQRVWSRSHKIIPKESLSKCEPSKFRVSYDNDNTPPAMSLLLGWEFARVWQKEHDEFIKKERSLKKTKVIRQPAYKSRVAARLLNVVDGNQCVTKKQVVKPKRKPTIIPCNKENSPVKKTDS